MSAEFEEVIEKMNNMPGTLEVGKAPVQVRALQFAFGEGMERLIEIPQVDWDKASGLSDWLELAFMYGQNDFQPRQSYSVSVGDVIDLGAAQGSYLVQLAGFKAMSTPMIEEWGRVPQRDRESHKWVH